MANVHVSGSGNPNLTVGGTSNARISTGNTTMPKYVGARAVVDRIEEGVRITLTDFRGTTQEIIAEAIADIITNEEDGTLTFVLPDGREIVTNSLRGPMGEDGFSPIANVSKVGGTATITITDKYGTTSAEIKDGIDSPGSNDVIDAYGRSAVTELSADWLSLTNGGPALTPEAGKVYILMQDTATYAANQLFRWSGSAYVPLTIAQEQSNWYESDTTSPAYIKNKPPLTITSYMYSGDKMKIAEIALTNSTPTALYASEWLIAEYNTTTYTNVKNAFDAKRDIVCKYTSSGLTWYLPLVDFDSANEIFYFSVVRNNTEILCTLENNVGWNYSETAISGVQSDWNQTTTTAADYIKNKPTIPSAEVFWATYGTTTSAQIETAYQNGLVVCTKYGNQIYTLCMRESGSVHNFSSTSKYEDGDVYISVIRCTNSVWSTVATVIPASASDIPAATSDLTNDSGFITASDIPVEVFWATYGTTTTAEIVQATIASKIIFAEYGSRVYSLSKINSSYSHDFTCFDSGVEYCISCNGNVWTASQTSFVPLDPYGKIDALYLPVYSGGVSP